MRNKNLRNFIPYRKLILGNVKNLYIFYKMWHIDMSFRNPSGHGSFCHAELVVIWISCQNQMIYNDSLPIISKLT